MVDEYSLVASATVELPRDLASVRGSIVADATVKTFHAHRGLKPMAKFNAPLTRRGETRKWIKSSLNAVFQIVQFYPVCHCALADHSLT